MLGGIDLYNRRLQANLIRNKEHGDGYAEWTRNRQDAIDSGEDPNAELIAKIEARQPDSYLERAWRRLGGKKKTEAEKREAKDAKQKKAMEAKATLRNEDDLGTVEVDQRSAPGKKDDGIIRSRDDKRTACSLKGEMNGTCDVRTGGLCAFDPFRGVYNIEWF